MKYKQRTQDDGRNQTDCFGEVVFNYQRKSQLIPFVGIFGPQAPPLGTKYTFLFSANIYDMKGKSSTQNA